MKIIRVETFLVEVPQKYPVAPYQSRYRSESSTRALLVRLESDDGLEGWGEAPQRYLGEPLTGREAAQLMELLAGRDPRDVEGLVAQDILDGEYLQSGVEMAMWDLAGKAAGEPVYKLLGGLVRDRIELAACMGIRPPRQAAAIARTYADAGYTTLKMKGGRSVAEDVRTASAVRDAVGDRLKLRIDPNTGYSPEQCRQLVKQLEPYELEYLEQPMPEEYLQESAAIRQQTSTPLALNESVTTSDVVQRILELRAADVLLPDTYQCGGMLAVKHVVQLAEQAGVPCVMHCAHDLGLKTAAMLHLVAALENFSLANDCTYYGLQEDVLVRPFQIQNGYLGVPAAPGLGVQVDLDQVWKYQLPSL